MKKHWKLTYLNVMVDMAGCPNRCRHCWLGSHPNGNMSIDDFKEIAAEFKNWRDEQGKGIAELGFFSWWREPDYRDDYRELWELEKQLSSPGRAQRFELLSSWRLSRDESYAKWAATLEPKVCQLSFFGMEKNTDWFVRRDGAFQDHLTATERLINAGIAPRWQLFITKKCLHELDEFLRLMKELDLWKRCEAIGRKFEFFIGGIAPEGSAFEIEDFRLEENDIKLIPKEMQALSRDGLKLLGTPEYKILRKQRFIITPANMSSNIYSVAVNANFDVYPNIAEPSPWWRLGNLKTDGIDRVIKAYRDETTPGMRANRSIPLKKLAKLYGEPESKKLYDGSDLTCRFMHQWGIENFKTREDEK